MISSMTGFARTETRVGEDSLVWELKSVNHRYLEIGLRLPEELKSLEPAVRSAIGGRLQRGKVDSVLRVAREDQAAGGFTVDAAMVNRLLYVDGEVGKLAPGSGDLRTAEILRWPGVLREPEADVEPLAKAALESLGSTIDELRESRATEGARIHSMLADRCDQVTDIVARVRAQLEPIRTALRRRLEERLAKLNVEANPERLEQELAIQIQKSDVDEELDRLDSHIEEIRAVIARDESVGRRLDFLMQELNREANTLASKSVDTDTTKLAVNLKVLIEQMREQVQNVE